MLFIDDFETAMKRCNRAQDTSNVDSDPDKEEFTSRRESRLPVRFQENSSSEGKVSISFYSYPTASMYHVFCCLKPNRKKSDCLDYSLHLCVIKPLKNLNICIHTSTKVSPVWDTNQDTDDVYRPLATLNCTRLFLRLTGKGSDTALSTSLFCR